MKYPDDLEIVFPEDVFYECQSCTKCCSNGWPIFYHHDKYQKFIKTPFLKKMQKKYPNDKIIELDDESNLGFLAKKENNCIMLENDLCLIHKELGSKEKPYCCRTFPIVFGITPKKLFVGLSYYCPSIQQNKGKPVSGLLPLVHQLLETGQVYDDQPDGMPLTKEVKVSWEGFFLIDDFIQECLEDNDIPIGIWEAMSSIAAFNIIKIYEHEEEADTEEIKDFFTYPPAVVMNRNAEFVDYQFEYAATLLSITEGDNEEEREMIKEKIINGGIINSSTFGRKIAIQPFLDYLEEKPYIWEHQEFRKYIKMLLWRKQLLPFNSVFSGLVSFYFIPLMTTWYTRVNAEVNNREVANLDDMREAMGIMDLYFNHFRELNDAFELFADEMMDKIECFFDDED